MFSEKDNRYIDVKSLRMLVPSLIVASFLWIFAEETLALSHLLYHISLDSYKLHTLSVNIELTMIGMEVSNVLSGLRSRSGLG